jgi:hypothetical protein
MKRAHAWLRGAWVAVAAGALAGCGGDNGRPVDNSTEEAKVAGTVKIRGKAMKGGAILLDASSAGRVTTARTIPVKADGSFEGTTYVGNNNVRISGDVVTKEPTLAYATKSVDVKSGSNTIDLEFP